MKDKYVVITGASSGIGYEIAIEFAKLNKNIVIAARRNDKLQELKTRIKEINKNLNVRVIPIDLSITSNVYDFYESLKDINIEVFINNAGFGNFDNVSNQNLEKIQKMIGFVKFFV